MKPTRAAPNPAPAQAQANAPSSDDFTLEEKRAEDLYTKRYFEVARRTDRLFMWLMVGQFVFGLLAAMLFSPRAWAGRMESVNVNIWAALFLGGIIVSFPIYLGWKRPGLAITRYSMSAAQMMYGALLIHLLGGRIETHFHIFGSLALLAFYRDWRVLLPATLVVVADHLVRQIVYPESIYGVSSPEWWRFIEHAFWVVFENAFLILNCLYSDRELREICRQQAAIERSQDLQADITRLLMVVSEASDGDLTVRAPISAGALGNVADGFNQLLESFQNFLKQVQAQIDRTNRATSAIRDSSTQMSAGATAQLNEVINATKLVERLSKGMAQVSKEASTAVEAAKRTEQTAQEGSQAVSDVISGMNTLRASVQSGAKKMKNLGDRSMEITTIVGTISKISEQTNMLALNAAIEAARAGEQGRGFSVVAEEVRKLAERTAVATQEIDRLVRAIHAETNETIEAIEQQTAVVENEAKVVSKAGDSLNRIRNVSTDSANIVVDISDIAAKQAEGTTDVVRVMDSVSKIARSTQTGVEKNTATVGELIKLADDLQRSMSKFKTA